MIVIQLFGFLWMVMGVGNIILQLVNHPGTFGAFSLILNGCLFIIPGLILFAVASGARNRKKESA